jgi:ubiquinone biosynthesis protein
MLHGVKITDIVGDTERRAMAQRVVEMSFQQLFEDGIFHGDPHPGNLLAMEGGRVGLLDLGVVGKLSPQMKQTLVVLTLAIALKDSDSVARLLYRVGIPDARTDLVAFRKDIAEVLARYLGKSLEQVDAASLLGDLFDLAVRYRIHVPKEYALLSRAAMAVEGILRQLDPTLDIGAAALPSLRKSMLSLLGGLGGSSSLEGGLLRGVLRLQELTQDVPAQLSQVLMDLGGGKFVVNVQAQAFTDMTAALRRLSVVMLGSSLGGSLVLGAFFSLSRQPWSFHGVPVLGTVAIALAAMLFGATASWYFVSVRLRKIRISKWIRGRGES